MGLKVWFPFLGDLNQQGCSDIKATNLGAVTSNNSGKIGKCMSFNGSATGALRLPPVLKATDDFSICFWVKFNNLSVNHCLFSQRTAINDLGFTIFWIQGQTGIRLDAGGAISGGYTRITNTTEWYHVVCCRDKSYKRIYINGELIREAAYTTTQASNVNSNYAIIGGSQNSSGGSTSDANYLNGYLNDYRIYDHCLSAAEVREISQGLVLHYKLDTLDIQSGTNLVTGVTAGGRTTVLTDGRIGVQTTGVNQDTYFTINLSENIVAGTSYLFTCDASGISNGQYWGFPLGAQGNSGVLPFKIYNGHNVYPFTANSTKSDGTAMDWGTKRLFMDDNYRGDWVNQACFYNFQLIKIGASDTIIKVEDSSGYNHNGTITGNITLNSNTPRYSVSSLFNGTERITTTTPGADIRTLSCWCKTTKDTNTSQIFVADSFSGMCISFYKNNVIGVFGTTRSTGSKSVLGTTYKAGEWNHIAVVKTGDTGTRDIYCNGIKLTPTTDDYWNSATGFFVGARNTSNANPYYGYLSDVRAYVTELNADAIRQLYEVGAKVDKGQNLHAFELNESNSGRELLAVPLTTAYNDHTSVYSGYDANGEITLTGKKSVGSGYLKINPTGHTYYYDIEMSSDANNVFYVGFERYDANKTARSNQACVYLSGLGGEKTARSHAHYHGTIDLSTDGVNPTDTIALRILNDWSSQSNRNGTIHRISLREVPSLQNSKINKRGQVITDELIEMDSGCRIQKNGTIEANEIIEL